MYLKVSIFIFILLADRTFVFTVAQIQPVVVVAWLVHPFTLRTTLACVVTQLTKSATRLRITPMYFPYYIKAKQNLSDWSRALNHRDFLLS